MNALARDAVIDRYLDNPGQFERLLRLLRSEVRKRHGDCPDAQAILRLFEAMHDRLQELEGIR